MGMTLSMEEKVQTAAETVIHAPAADETVTDRIVHVEDFDPLFAMSEEDCVEGFIKREMQRAGITEEQNLIPEDMLRRKNILNAVLAVLLFVYISLFFFHFPMKTYVIGLIILVVYAFLTSRYQLIKYLKKEIRSRSQEKISNIVMNVKASMVPDYSKKLKWALMAVAVAGSLLLFSKPRIFYEQADAGYYVRFYVYGLTNMTTATIPDTYQGETVVLLSKGEIDSKKVRVEFSLEDMDMSGFQKGATYEQIKAYVLEHTGLKVSSLYISQIKRKCGLDVGQNYNLSKKEDAKVPKCPPEKEAAIRDALKYFQMI